MMRSLWTAASGMKGMQTSVDTIANNISNVNTTGFKAKTTQFKSLLYQTLQSETTSANGDTKPGAAQVGLGTRVSSTNSIFTDGALLANDSKSALAISGSGFFGIRGVDGETYYTRNGDFTWTLNANGDSVLATSGGNPVLDSAGNPIILASTIPTDSVAIGKDGSVAYKNPDGTYTDTNQDVGLYQFRNPTGLEETNNSLFRATDASGQALNEATNPNLTPSTIAQGYLEGSNVNVADEMVNLIISQRAYELNSKAITTSDTMLETANNLKR